MKKPTPFVPAPFVILGRLMYKFNQKGSLLIGFRFRVSGCLKIQLETQNAKPETIHLIGGGCLLITSYSAVC